MLATVAIGSVLAYVVVALQRIDYPYELTYFEGSTVEVSARVATGEPLYGPPTTAFTPWPYPLRLWSRVRWMRFTGVDSTTMRLVSFLASPVVPLVLLALVVRRATGSTVAGVVAAGLFAATYRVSGAFFDTGRVDSLFLAFAADGGARRDARAHLAGRRRPGGRAGPSRSSPSRTPSSWPHWKRCGWSGAGVRGHRGRADDLAGVVGSTLVGSLLTDGWYARYVVAQLPSQVELRWLYDFWWQDLVLPFAVSLLVVGVLLVLGRPTVTRYAAEGRGCPGLCRRAPPRGLGLAAARGRVHANVAMPARAALCGALGVLLATWFSTAAGRGRMGGRGPCGPGRLHGAVARGSGSVPGRSRTPRPVRRDLEGLCRAVLVPTHPYYLRLAGRLTHASSIAVDDLYRAAGGPQALAGVVPWDLDGVSAVVLDNPTDVRLFGDALTRDFTLVTTTVVPAGVFVPMTDLPTHPALLYVRTSELGIGPPSALGCDLAVEAVAGPARSRRAVGRTADLDLFLRSRRTWTVTVEVSPKSQPHTRRISCSLVNASCGWDIR